MKAQAFLIGVCLTIGFACDSGNQSPYSAGFAVYLLKDPDVTASQAWLLPLESLTLANMPFLTQADLRSYSWQTHEFTAATSVDTQLSDLAKRHGPTGGIPFVVTVGRERIYLGAFWYLYSSLAPQVPYIDVIGNPHRISPAWTAGSQPDRRYDGRVYETLKAAGLLAQ